MSRSTLARIAAAAAITVALCATPSGATSPTPRPVDEGRTPLALCRGTMPLMVSDLARGVACDLTGRVVEGGDVKVVVPPPGHGVTARGTGVRPGAASAGLSVQNIAGVVTAWRGQGATPEGGGVHAAAPLPACKDTTFKLYGPKHAWRTKLRWSYNSSGQQAGLGGDRILAAIKRGGQAMARGKNDCGLDRRIDASIGYLGKTSARPSIRGTASGAMCLAGDQNNTVGWGRIGGDSLGWTCVYWDGTGAITGADILLKPSPIHSIGVPANCRFRLDLQSLLTHEWGHAFGLDHVSYAHANLVMPHAVEVCSTSDRTLGRGDYLGLKALYGLR